MKKKTQFSKMLKRFRKDLMKQDFRRRAGAVVTAVVLMMQSLAPSLAQAANELGTYNEFQLSAAMPVVTYDSGDGSFDVSLTGTGTASPFTWSSYGYYVRINWADGNTALSDTPDSGVMDTFAAVDTETLTGGWAGTHTFAAEGTYNVVVELFHNPNQPHQQPIKVPSESNLENDGIRARITVPVVLEVPEESSEPTDENVTICQDEQGYRVSAQGGTTLSPFTWSSYGYYVRATWDDGAVTYSDTPGSDATDTFEAFNTQTLTGEWEAMHTYTEEGIYELVVDLFHNPNQPHQQPIKVPSESNLENDVLKYTETLNINTDDAVPCNPPQEEPEPELPLDIDVDDVTVCSVDGGYNVELSGMGGGSPYTWSSFGYYVTVNWDDGNTEDSDTPYTGVSDGFYGSQDGTTLSGTWNADHMYTSGGTYDVSIQMFHNPNQPHQQPIKVPATSNKSNDVLKAATSITINTAEAPACEVSETTSSTVTIQKVWVTDDEQKPAIAIYFNNGLVQLDSETLSATFTQPAGTYPLSENAVEGFTTSISCSDGYFTEGALTLDDGDNAVCTITNTEIVEEDDDNDNGDGGEGSGEPGTLTVIKNTVNDDEGGTDYTSDNFLLTVSWTMGEATSSMMFRGSTGTQVEIPAGASYSVTESPFLASFNGVSVVEGDTEHGYAVSFDGSCSGTMTSNGALTCTVTNNDPEPSDEENNGGNGGSGGSETSRTTDTGGGGGTSSFSFFSAPPAPAVLGVQNTDETILTCAEQYPEAALITGELDDLLAAYGFTRNTSLEQVIAGTLLPKILLPDTASANELILQNFIVYGIQALMQLGAGERAGIVATFTLLYGHLPMNECDWQNVIRIGEGVVPVILVTEREAAVEDAFEEIYNRPADRSVPQDNVTILIMAYGLRPDVRSLKAERQAANIFKAIYGSFPRNTSEWDISRGIAYGGIQVPGYPEIVR